MPGREIENVVFLGNTEIFKERKLMAFLLLLRPTYIQKLGELKFLSLTGLYLNFVASKISAQSTLLFIEKNDLDRAKA